MCAARITAHGLCFPEHPLVVAGVVQPTACLTPSPTSPRSRPIGSGPVSPPLSSPRPLAARGGQRPRRRSRKTRTPCPPACGPPLAAGRRRGPGGLPLPRPGGRAQGLKMPAHLPQQFVIAVAGGQQRRRVEHRKDEQDEAERSCLYSFICLHPSPDRPGRGPRTTPRPAPAWPGSRPCPPASSARAPRPRSARSTR